LLFFVFEKYYYTTYRTFVGVSDYEKNKVKTPKVGSFKQ